MSGESSSNFYDLKDVGPVELATMSFGQRFTITPLQLITAVSGLVNDGNLMQPRIVSKVVDPDTGISTDVQPVFVRQVVSSDTSTKIKDMMGSVVTEGTGGPAAVKGYSIGGKSGTSEPQPGREKEDGYVASFIGISPVQNPQIIVLVALYKPQGASHQGGTVTAPVVSKIFTDVLPYLGVSSSVEEKEKTGTVKLPDLKNKTLTEARQILEASGLRAYMKSTMTDSSSALVVNQSPKSGTTLSADSIVCLYASSDASVESKTVPDLIGKTVEQAKNSLNSLNLNIMATGTGVVSAQDIAPGTSVEEGSIITVTLSQ